MTVSPNSISPRAPVPVNLRTKLTTGLRVLVLTAGICAAAYSIWFYKQSNRPGRVHYLRGLDLIGERKPRSAATEWMLGIRQDPNYYPNYEEMGDLLSQAHRLNLAANYYGHGATLARTSGGLYLKLSQTLRELGNSKGALTAAQRAYNLLPNSADAAGQYGILQAEDKNRQVALVALRRAHQLRPSDRRYLLAYAESELDSLDLAGAERDLQPYLTAHPTDAQASFLMAVVYNQKSRTPLNIGAAIGYCQSALPGMPGDPRVVTVLGQLYLDSNRPRDALQLYLNSLKTCPVSQGTLNGMVSAYARLGDSKHAQIVGKMLQQFLARQDRVEHLKHVMGFNHNDVAAGLELAALEEQMGATAVARAYFEQLVRQNPVNKTVRAALVGFYQRHGLNALAIDASRGKLKL